mmetsp:Transcript_6039/g.5633  ORF Transcript_6039/g.5633 Transcript_6039/m.5633 type:complete len:151 (-) Transcript_6039:111-563(-)|eukprot:CAMPEP_0197823930 /NCGR_PEP_ID=MMETSP1437-20131217/1248_1 /TAXON_ID=49252 ORGANISM="Eucampia antarctica, Strain CCMP1452" /NCGR_SAMPLE_ID=MMETSP1437 /ASSEMBLY_ACC=CAM_ASM_001096 /LENGTH=150 /DNA_ID=CAMNT_0043423343 /DNA_START=59 /DNA_END=511 /DNA_ORIENTATION=-
MKVLSFVAVSIVAPLVAGFAPKLSISRPSLASSQLDMGRIEFVKGLEEKVIPDIKLTRAKDGSSGTAKFQFSNPNVFDASTASEGEITGMYLVDDEGELTTSDVNANFVNGKPQSISSLVVLNSPEEWDRFMRFMEKYGEANGLVFNKAK